MTVTDSPGDQVETLRLAVYHAFANDGRAPGPDALAHQLGAHPSEIEAGLQELARQRHVVRDADGRIVMAHPFAAIPLGFSVMGTATLWWGGCAWDSFALPHLLPADSPVLVATRWPRLLPAPGLERGYRRTTPGRPGRPLPGPGSPHLG